MYLKSIKLAGFKSFADVTTIPIRSQMNAIVGPNGCGKSNVIDAVRWVIGESSAKQLRGQSMSDVIFNGTSSRKPMGKAAIELNFDNSDSRIGGEFANYNEITIRREVQREGQSNYFINNTVCRRRDIIDIFRGTGLGARSYAIIEQGMISQLIEAKPEEMRNHLEEAANISTYKARRRETENRMKRTQENLSRLTDLREEIDKQLSHLKRQANAAERYKELKVEERSLNAQIKALHWQLLNEQLQTKNQEIQQQDVKREALMTEQRHVETEIEKLKVSLGEFTHNQNEVQKEFYGLAADIARIEQRIKSSQEQSQRWQAELEDSNAIWSELESGNGDHDAKVKQLTSELNDLRPQSTSIDDQVLTADHELQSAQEKMAECQKQWEQYQSQQAENMQKIEVARTNIQHYREQIANLEQRVERLREEHDAQAVQQLQRQLEPLWNDVEKHRDALEQMGASLQQTTDLIAGQRDQNNQLSQELKQLQQTLREEQSECAGLQAIQKSELEGDDVAGKQWLQQQKLSDQPRLGQSLQVKSGWEKAVETVLRNFFDAVCVKDVKEYIKSLASDVQGDVFLLAKTASTQESDANKFKSLQDCIDSDWPITDLISGVYAAESVEQALSWREQLAENESVVTRCGLWLGKHWVRISKVVKDEDSILLREQKIQTLQKTITESQQQVAECEEKLQTGEQSLFDLEAKRDEQHQSYQSISETLTEAKTQHTALHSKLEEVKQQQQRIAHDLSECDKQLTELHKSLASTEELLQQGLLLETELSSQKEALLERRQLTTANLDAARKSAQQTQQRADELGIRLTSNESQLKLLQETMTRNKRQMSQLSERRAQLQENLADSGGPLQRLNQELQQKLDQRLKVEKELHAVEAQVQNTNDCIDGCEQRRSSAQDKLANMQSDLEKVKMEHQAIAVRQTTIDEQLREANMDLQAVLVEMPEKAELSEWEQRAATVERRIGRLGAINLAAIDEFKTLSARSEYLEKQHADLEEALSVLQNAIRKIDKETKVKFKDTFDRVNVNFQKNFPKIFGGGRAYLQLEGDDLLSAGIVVHAQPPGKRNTTIHMLSGGEKALTAIALVFSFFQLNPAPFCILDEVDAPLDDLNVGRFCDIVKEMSDSTQFLIISHNKVTIESADNLMGVTMQEPGVSRLVSVDIEEAITMVE
ncbi:MAG: chromosome segregation protein SMC [Gammaproteobacteria bacterium]|nr:chromosome segregation protein SMC [Gammaproteobacteria bacterium]